MYKEEIPINVKTNQCKSIYSEKKKSLKNNRLVQNDSHVTLATNIHSMVQAYILFTVMKNFPWN